MAQQNRVLGKGELYFDKFIPNTTTRTGERYIGNTPELTMTTESETLDHFDSDHGIRVKDDSVTLETNRTGAFTTDNISVENVSLLLLGSAQDFTPDVTPVVDEAVIVQTGLTYQLGLTQGSGAGVRDVTGVVVTDDTDTTTYVLDVDYTLDEVLGRVTIITAEEGGSITDDQTLHFDYTPGAMVKQQMVSGAETIEGSLRFVCFNPKGLLTDFYFPRVLLSPQGDFALKGDDWQAIGFQLEILQLDDDTPAVVAQRR